MVSWATGSGEAARDAGPQAGTDEEEKDGEEVSLTWSRTSGVNEVLSHYTYGRNLNREGIDPVEAQWKASFRRPFY